MAKFSLEQVNDMYYDVLKELGNIGAGNATTAISNMLNLKVDMKVPKVQFLDFQELPSAISAEEDTVAGIYLEVETDIGGSMMFLLKMESAHYLVNRLMGRPDDYMVEFNEMDLSALKEIGNIISGSYLSALSTITNMVITASVPYLAIDMAAAILSVPAIQFGQYGDKALLIATEFGDDITIEGFFILMPDIDSYDKILTSLGVAL
ncbi:MAG: chemotaxis protein CheC [Lachnospiraceae bacterium]|jgi:chemotaxis protein CheC|nr:chemotaxis protein CheC [Lachnospiraceae bacterium]